jgi:CRP-like cAMP-binding protein
LLMQPNRILIENFFNNKIERFKKDEILFNHGSPSAFLYFIVEGQIETIINNQKRVLHNNEYFGELSIINNSKRVGDAKVVSDWAKVIKIPQLAFKKLLKEDISFQNDILKNLNKIIIN